MKWNKAVKEIEEAINNGEDVVIRYHIKHDTRQTRVMDVESVIEYEYKGSMCKAINTYDDQVLEGMHVIDEVAINKFFELRK